jgi:hypothetical protein
LSGTVAPGGGFFFGGLTAPVRNNNAGAGGFGGGGNGDATNEQSGGAGGYSGGSGAMRTNVDTTGGGGGSFISTLVTDVATSDGTYEELSIFPAVTGSTIENLNSYNYGDGSVVVVLEEQFSTGNTVHPTAEDANDNTNAIAIEPAGISYHAFLPISYDIENDTIYSTTPHNFETGQSVAFDFVNATPDISTSQIYPVSVVDDYSYQLIGVPFVNFTTPTARSDSDFVRRIVVNTATNSFNIPNHGFTLNQPVQYSYSDGDDNIAPLQKNQTYYISEVIDADNFKIKLILEDGPENSINLTSAGTGTNHSFIFLTVNFISDTLYIPSHGLSSGQKVKYSTNGGTVVGGLTNDEIYYVRKVDNSIISLFSDPDIDDFSNIVNLSGVGAGTHSLITQSIDFTTNTINLPNHGFRNGELVDYDARDEFPIGGLTSNQQYYVINVDRDNVKLATSFADAEDGIAVDLTASPAGVGRDSLTSLSQTPDGIYEISSIPSSNTFTLQARGQVQDLFKAIDPRSSVNPEINTFFVESHGFLTGTKVFYSVGDASSAIEGLSNNTNYYVVTINQDYFRLAESVEDALSGITIVLGGIGTGSSHSLTTNQLNGSVVGSGNVSSNAGSVLVDGIGTSFSKILKVGDQFTIYPENDNTTFTFAAANIDTGSNRITSVTHPFTTGDIVKFDVGAAVSTPGGLTNNYYYYVGVIDATNIQLYNSEDGAISGSGFITFSSAGEGTSFTLTGTVPRGPIVRRITAVGSDTQITVDRPYSSAFSEVDYAYPTFVYVRPSGYSLHRPFDGGVEMSTGSQNSYGQIIRQTRKYFRYQSGKGIQTSFAINFKPSVDIENMERFNENTMICRTRRPHNLVSGLFIQINEARDSSGELSELYNGNFQVTVVEGSDTTFTIPLGQNVPEGDESRPYGFPQFHVTSWTNGALRSGMFDFQNGMFFEFDGEKLYAVRRSSTQQTAGTVSALRGSELVFGDNTKFASQLEVGDYVVMRGQTYKVINIDSETRMAIRPEYRGSTGLEISFNPETDIDTETGTFSIRGHGLTQSLPVIYNSIDGDPVSGLISGSTYYVDQIDANNFRLFPTPDAESTIPIPAVGSGTEHSFVPAKTGIIITKTVDTKVPQDEWNIDKCDGTGPSGYDLDLSKIQMCYMDYSWYGAGKIRFGFKVGDGLVKYVHEFKHNNILYESYFRSGNLPARYEVVTGLNPTYIPSLFHWGTSVIMDGTFDDDRGYLFTANGQTLDIAGTTTKSFAANGINVSNDLITSLTHGFNTGDIVQFQSIASSGFPGLNNLNPSTQIVGSNTFANLTNTETYGVLVNSADRIHLTPPNATFVSGGTVSRTGSTVTVTTNSNHNLVTGMYVGIYGITNANLVDANGPFVITRTGATTFTYTKAGTAQTVVTESGLAISEVINFTDQGNTQYTYFLYPNGSLNNTTGPNYQPLLSLRLSPSVDSGLTGKLGDRDVINRMQVRIREVGISTDELVEVKLVLNGRLNNLGFTSMPSPSLVELVEHTPQDTISGGVQVYNFQASGGQGGDKVTTTVDVDTLFELSNSILGGDNIFPDGPDILTIAVSRLTGNSTRAAAKLSWGEAQA